jgi:type I restriction enzyme S subunit
MIDGLKPYPAMKDSGVPCLGQVPEHWDVRRLRNVAELRVSNVDKNVVDGERPVLLCNYVDVYKNEVIHANMPFMRATASQREIERFRLQCGDVLITKDSEDWQDIGVPAYVAQSADDLLCGYHLAILRPFGRVSEGRFLYWGLRSVGSRCQFSVNANGITRYGLSHGAIKEVLVPLPPLDEQRAIVRFLDHADRLIRRYIGAKRKLIRLLEEQKQAIIHRAVTRGLDPNVRLKPSGVEWLGDVPAHWEIVRNGRLFAQRNETGFAELPILEVSLRTGARVRQFENGARKQVMIDRDKYKRAAKGDLAYNMMRMWQGAVGVAPVDGLVSPAYVVASPLPGVDVRYFANLFRTPAYMGEVNNHSRGIVKDRNRLYWDDFKQILSPYPPPAEQKEIADFLDSYSASIATTRERVDREIFLLREYRTRLIADVVTGKLDVRAAAAALPEPQEAPDDLETEAEAPDEEEIETAEEADVEEVAA